jgi:hypothetical protein
MKFTVVIVCAINIVLTLVVLGVQETKPILTVIGSTPNHITHTSLYSTHADTSKTDPFLSALIAMERSNLIDYDTRIDIRPLVSTTRGELSKTLTLSEEALQERRRWVETRGFSVGDVMAANACYGISGPPPPNVGVSEWKRRFPAHCRSGARSGTVAFGPLERGQKPCSDDDPIRLRSRTDKLDDADQRTWAIAAVKVSGHRWTRYQLSMHYDATADTWHVGAISTCLSISA